MEVMRSEIQKVNAIARVECMKVTYINENVFDSVINKYEVRKPSIHLITKTKNENITRNSGNIHETFCIFQSYNTI